VTEHQIDRLVVVAVAVIVLVLAGLIAALGFLVGWLPAAILFAAVVLLVFMVLVAN
jgi:xanthine/uracil permease